jgi:hypothetical protein
MGQLFLTRPEACHTPLKVWLGAVAAHVTRHAIADIMPPGDDMHGSNRPLCHASHSR